MVRIYLRRWGSPLLVVGMLGILAGIAWLVVSRVPGQAAASLGNVAAPTMAPPVVLSGTEAAILGALNQGRAAAGQAPLAIDSQLSEEAAQLYQQLLADPLMDLERLVADHGQPGPYETILVIPFDATMPPSGCQMGGLDLCALSPDTQSTAAGMYFGQPAHPDELGTVLVLVRGQP